MADDKDKEPTSGPGLPSDDGTPDVLPVDGAMHEDRSDETSSDAADHPVELGSEADDSEAFAADSGSDESDTDGAGGDPDAGDVPEELREDDEAEPGDMDPVDEAEPGNEDPSDDRELVSVGAPARSASAADEVVSGPTRSRTKKDKATPKQTRAVEKERRTGPVKFVKESADELRKVVYPTRQQLAQYFVVVLIFVLFIIGIVSLLDLGFGWAIFKIFS